MRHVTKRGYIYRTVNGKTRAEHLVVWEAANGPIPSGHVIHHIDKDRSNNDLSNLKLMTRVEHGKWHGRGEYHAELQRAWEAGPECAEMGLSRKDFTHHEEGWEV